MQPGRCQARQARPRRRLRPRSTPGGGEGSAAQPRRVTASGLSGVTGVALSLPDSTVTGVVHFIRACRTDSDNDGQQGRASWCVEPFGDRIEVTLMHTHPCRLAATAGGASGAAATVSNWIHFFSLQIEATRPLGPSGRVAAVTRPSGPCRSPPSESAYGIITWRRRRRRRLRRPRPSCGSIPRGRPPPCARIGQGILRCVSEDE